MILNCEGKCVYSCRDICDPISNIKGYVRIREALFIVDPIVSLKNDVSLLIGYFCILGDPNLELSAFFEDAITSWLDVQ